MDCQCRNCDMVRANALNDVWIHKGRGNMTLEQFNNVEVGTSVKFIFDQPIRRSKYNGFGFDDKPKNVIWFSNGTWLYDPYCGGCHEDNTTKVDKKVVVIKSPKNILRISTITELEAFINKYQYYDKYGKRYYGTQTYTEYMFDIMSDLYDYLVGNVIRKCAYMNWDKVYSDGYYGVAFTFRRWDQLYEDGWSYNSRYNWHDGYDVESLMIFDTRAFDDANIEIVSILT